MKSPRIVKYRGRGQRLWGGGLEGYGLATRRFIEANRLGLGFVAAMAPLAFLLSLQVVWLTDLDQASKLAQRAALRNCLEAVGNEVSYFYRSTAERLLNVPEAFFSGRELDPMAHYWQSRNHDGVRRLFAVDYTQSQFGRFSTFDPFRGKMILTPASDESLAIILAAMPWQSWVRPRLSSEDTLMLHVNEQDKEHRIIFKPVVAEQGRITGLVGLIIDTDYVRQVLFPGALDPSSRVCFGFDGPPPSLFVQDGRDSLVFGRSSTAKKSLAVTIHPSFVLRDWTVGAMNSGPSNDWMRGSLAYNLTLGFVLALALMIGILITLWGARDAMRLSQMKTDFVSNVSHELRTPLASVRLFADMMMKGRVSKPEKVVEYGSYIEAETRRLSRLIENILEFSRIESQQKEYRCSATPVFDVIESVLEAFSVQTGEHRVQVTWVRPDEPGPIVVMDADAVEQALRNLLDNAIKYSGESMKVVIDVRNVDEYAIISVQDFGIGIAKEDQARIFERFHRVSTGLVHDVKGSGLGLAIVEHIARAHGGRVTLQSRLDVGSTFSLWLPRQVPAGIEDDKDSCN